MEYVATMIYPRLGPDNQPVHTARGTEIDVHQVRGDFESADAARESILLLIDSAPALDEDDDYTYEFAWKDYAVYEDSNRLGPVGFGIEDDNAGERYVAAIIIITEVVDPARDAVQELIEEYLMEEWKDE
ncbi:hypothetical protein SEA_KEELAN_27 [Gordonia phage Keelan]|nr:hypothetical protein SEA_KEELAN_27 [Gordonia phage Keelan]